MRINHNYSNIKNLSFMSLKRSRTGSFALVTQDAGFSANVPTYGGGYARPRTKGGSKTYRKSSRMYRPNVTSAIRSFNWKQRETKMISAYFTEVSMNTLTTLGEVIEFPYPALGTGANQRVGNKLDGVGLKVKLLFHNNNSIPIHVRFLILQIPQGERFTNTAILNELFDVSTPGNVPETATAPAGNTSDLIRSINRGEIKVIRDKVVPLLSSSVDTGIAMEDVYIKTPGRVTFADSAQTTPINNRYIVVLIPRRSDNDEGMGSTVELTGVVTKYWKD